jgi:hypothetical protein
MLAAGDSARCLNNSEDSDDIKTGTLSFISSPLDDSWTISKPQRLVIDKKLHTDERSLGRNCGASISKPVLFKQPLLGGLSACLGLAILSEESQSEREQNVEKVASELPRFLKQPLLAGVNDDAGW